MPRIYLACLACYNEGRHHGEWLDAANEDLHSALASLQAKCGHVDNDYAIHDFEDFAGLKLGESEPLARVEKYANLIEEHGDAIAKFIDNDNGHVDVSDIEEEFQNAYLGRHDSLEAYAEDWAEQSGMLAEVPESLRNYFDFKAFGRDLELGGDVWTVDAEDGGVHVFSNK